MIWSWKLKKSSKISLCFSTGGEETETHLVDSSEVASTTLQPFLLERSPTFRYGNEVHCSLVGRITWLFSSRSSRDSTVTDAVTIPSLVMCSNTSINLSKASSKTSKLPTRERSKVLVTCVEGSNNQESKRKTTFLASGDLPHNKGFEVSISFSGASPHSNDNDLQVEDVFSSFCQVTFIRTKFLKQSASHHATVFLESSRNIPQNILNFFMSVSHIFFSYFEKSQFLTTIATRISRQVAYSPSAPHRRLRANQPQRMQPACH